MTNINDCVFLLVGSPPSPALVPPPGTRPQYNNISLCSVSKLNLLFTLTRLAAAAAAIDLGSMDLTSAIYNTTDKHERASVFHFISEKLMQHCTAPFEFYGKI